MVGHAPIVKHTSGGMGGGAVVMKLNNVTRFCPHMTYAGHTHMKQYSPAMHESVRALASGLVVDIGALDGQDAVNFALGHRVWSFEANSEKLPRIRTRLKQTGTSGNVTLHGVALSNYTGTAKFLADPGARFGDDRLADGAALPGDEERRLIDVPIRTLDSFADADTQIIFVKIDAQGHDYRVLRGAAALLSGRRIARVVFEYTPEMMPGGAAEAEEQLHWLHDIGYACAPCNSKWSRVAASTKPVRITEYVGGYWADANHTRLRGFDNIVCVPSASCGECAKLVP